MIKDIMTRCIASLSLLGRIMVVSNCKVEIIPIVDITLINHEKTPNSAGEYILEMIGVNSMGIICARPVPLIKVKTFLENSDLRYLLIILL